jgi:hypothetical protein
MSWLPMLATRAVSRRARDPIPGAAAIRDLIENTPDLYPRLELDSWAPAIVPPVASTVILGRADVVSVARDRATGATMARLGPAV